MFVKGLIGDFSDAKDAGEGRSNGGRGSSVSDSTGLLGEMANFPVEDIDGEDFTEDFSESEEEPDDNDGGRNMLVKGFTEDLSEGVEAGDGRSNGGRTSDKPDEADLSKSPSRGV